MKLADPSAFESFAAAVDADPRLDLKAYPERDYYEGQSETTGTLIRVFAHLRHRDPVDRRDVRRDEHDVRGGRLPHARNRHAARARFLARCASSPRFSPSRWRWRSSAASIGCMLALPVHGLSTGAMNMTSFSELAFKFRITPALLASGLMFSAVMGAVGGLLPAIRAARIPVARALREI